MVAGAEPVAVAAVISEVHMALSGLSREARWEVLAHHLAALARESGEPAVFLALAHQAMRQRMGLAA